MKCLLITLATAVGLVALANPTRPRQVPVEDRTARLLKALSPVEAYHSTLFEGLGGGNRILETLSGVTIQVQVAEAEDAPKSVRERIQSVACAYDAMFSGVVLAAATHPSADGQFLFTSYQIRPMSIFKSPPKAAITPAKTVTLVRAGGELTVAGTTVTARHNAFPALTIGDTYYFAAEHLDRFGTYKSPEPINAFRRSADSVRTHGLSLHERLDEGIQAQEFEDAMRTAKCSGVGRQVAIKALYAEDEGI